MPLSGPLTEEEIATGKEIFEALDQDGDGKITTDDLNQALQNLGVELNEDQLKAIIAKADADGSGVVTWDEFLKVLEKRPIKRRIEAALRELFNEFDTDNSGFISPENLRQLINDAGYADQVTDDDITELISRVDTTGDGKISFDEFLAVFIDV